LQQAYTLRRLAPRQGRRHIAIVAGLGLEAGDHSLQQGALQFDGIMAGQFGYCAA